MIKYILSIIIVHFCVVSLWSQTEEKKFNMTPYASLCISMGNIDKSDPATDNFSKASFPSVEVGLMGKNVSVGAVFGGENIFVSSSTRWFYELKTSISKPIGNFGVYGLAGFGAFFEREFNAFIEYGAGFSYMPNHVGYFVQYSNWAKGNYVSTGISYAF